MTITSQAPDATSTATTATTPAPLLALSSPQRQIWFDQALRPGVPTYNIGGYVLIEGAVDADLFAQALAGMARKHDSLRTVLVAAGPGDASGVPQQTFADDLPTPLDLQDFSRLPDPLGHALPWMQQRLEQPFELLGGGPLARHALLKLAADRYCWQITMHHLVADGWAIALYCRSAAEIYSALAAGRSPELGAPSYAEFVADDQRYRQGDSFQRHRSHWLQRHAAPAAPLLAPPAAGAPASSERCSARLPRARYDALASLAQAHGGTVFHALLALLGVYFARCHGRDELVVGLPILHRAGPAFKASGGVFVGVNAVRLGVDMQAGFGTLLRSIGRVLHQDYRHQRYPLAELQREMLLQRGLDRRLFDISLSYERHDYSTSFAGAPGQARALVNRWQAVPLTLFVREFHPAQDVELDLSYNRACFDAAEAAALQARLLQLIDSVLADAAMPVAALPLLTPADHARLAQCTGMALDIPLQACVHDLFEAQVARTPQAPALHSGDAEPISYAELNRRANRLAHQLRSLGVLPDARVAICAGRGVDMVVAVLATAKAGGAYVPLDAAYPVQRLAAMVQDSQPAVLLCDRDIDAALLQPGLPVLDLRAPAAWAHCSEGNPQRAAVGLQPGHLAYVIYTSGSTGTPKGVMVEHRGVVNLVCGQAGVLNIGAGSRVLQFASFSFDACAWEIYTTLTQGGALVLPQAGTVLAGAELVAAIEGHAVTHATLTPSVLAAVAEPAALPTLHTLVVAGEACPAALVQRWAAGRRFINAYGPTEASVCATEFVCDPARGDNPPIGRPVANVRIHILDAQGQQLPPGAVGELHIGGPGVARGYLHRPALTAERFRRDPWSSDPDARLYRTGDLARLRADGEIEYLGRNDQQVKLRGFRIETGEIEARLLQHPALQDAAVLARAGAGGDAGGDARLVAYYTLRPGQSVSTLALREHLAQTLPAHMLPALLQALAAMPLTPNGKLDRAALPAPQAAVAADFEAPRGATETTLAGLWAELLQTGAIGRRSHFFMLGGHSLLAVRLVSLLRQALGAEFSLAQVFAHPVLADMAQALDSAGRSQLPPLTLAARGVPLPLSFAQQRLWFLAQLEGGSRAYHVAGGFRLRGPLHSAALRLALDRIVDRHESLRTSFTAQGGQPVQRIAPPGTGFTLAEHDLRGQPDAQAQLAQLAQDEAQAAFDLEQGPLLRGRLVALADDDHVLLLTMHHLVSDGWSMGVLVRELAALYAAYGRGAPDPLPALPLQYADYAAWQRRWLEGEHLAAQVAYWVQQLKDAPALLELPTDRPRPLREDHAGAVLDFELDPALSAGLRALAARHGTTLFMTLLGAWGLLMSRLSGQLDVVIGTPVAHRTRAEIEPLIGFFVNTLALRLDLSGAPDVGELLARVKRCAVEAQSHQDLPFEQLVEILRPARTLAHNPVFQVMFAWQNFEAHDVQLHGLEIQRLQAPHVTTLFDLKLELAEAGGCIAGNLEYSTALFNRSTAQRLLGYLRVLLQAMAEGDTRSVQRLPLLPAPELEQLTRGWNATAQAYPRQACLHELFEAQVRRTPQALALSDGVQTLDYAALNSRANHLALQLRGLGLGPDGVVALCLRRDVDLVVAMLAVLKAGGAYVPLDPAYPVQRLAQMLADSQPAVVLSHTPVWTQLGPELPLAPGQTLLTLDGQAWPDSPVPDLPRGDLGPAHLAYLIYTSGSTGVPKGVCIEHRNAVNFVSWALGGFSPQELQHTLLSTSLNFDLAVFETYVPLACGGAVHIVPNALALLQQPVAVSLLNTVPSALEALLQHGGLPDSVTTVNLAGEPLQQALVQKLFERSGVQRVCNLYGPSETTTYSTWVSMPRESGFVGHIGRPVGNTQVYLLDSQGQPVPQGVVGELFIAGDGVARGYLHQPQLTQERFLADPFLPGGRMYRTGDLARHDAQGHIEFLGRNDHQVKLRGYRIELGEIEARLLQHPRIREAVVIAREDEQLRRLVAYVVGDTELDSAELRAHLAQSLPEHMLPAAYVQLEQLPRTPNGKLHRQALPAPGAQAYAARSYEAPQGDTEQTLARIWADVLALEQVGRHDNFFELGGHSLLALGVMERMRQAGLAADVRRLFTRPTVAALAADAGPEQHLQVPANPLAAWHRSKSLEQADDESATLLELRL